MDAHALLSLGPVPGKKDFLATNWAMLADLELDDGLSPLYERLYMRLREQITHGKLPPRSRLPSTRQLVDRLGISRTTVITAYAQLHADGLIVSKKGSGTYVADGFSEEIEKNPAFNEHKLRDARSRMGSRISHRGDRYQATNLEYLSLPNIPFNTGVVRIDEKSAAKWQQLIRQKLVADSLFQGYRDPQDNEPLRREISQYVGVTRGVRCTKEQVILVAGAQQGIDLSIKVLLDPGQNVWVEDPGYPLTRAALNAAGMQLCYLPVDAEGMLVADGIQHHSDAAAAFVTPSHQYPMGVSLSVARRNELLDWATRHRGWIVEDDYDSEFRYEGVTLPALQGLDQNGTVIYIGSFSKVLQPAIRSGYVIVPDSLIKAFKAARFLTDRHSPPFLENVLTEFIKQGHFVSHIQRMKFQYRDARDFLIHLLTTQLGKWLEVKCPNQGLHLIVHLRSGIDDRLAAEEAKNAGVVVRPLSGMYSHSERARSGLMLGFAGFRRADMENAVHRLGKALHNCEMKRRG